MNYDDWKTTPPAADSDVKSDDADTLADYRHSLRAALTALAKAQRIHPTRSNMKATHLILELLGDAQ